MIFWLSDAFSKSTATVWKDVKDEYFKCNGQEVLQFAMDWSKHGNQRLADFAGHVQVLRKSKAKPKSGTALGPTAPVNLLKQLAEKLELPISEKDYIG